MHRFIYIYIYRGHVHNVLRTCPITNGTCVTAAPGQVSVFIYIHHLQRERVCERERKKYIFTPLFIYSVNILIHIDVCNAYSVRRPGSHDHRPWRRGIQRCPRLAAVVGPLRECRHALLSLSHTPSPSHSSPSLILFNNSLATCVCRYIIERSIRTLFVCVHRLWVCGFDGV